MNIDDRPPGKLISLPSTQIPERVVPIHPSTLDTIRAQLVAAEAREVRLLIEISKLHETIGYMRSACESALGHCMKRNSIQAVTLLDAIEKAKAAL